MKKHSMYGADMLEALPFYQDEPLPSFSAPQAVSVTMGGWTVYSN